MFTDFKAVLRTNIIQWNSVNTVTNGPKKFGRINEGFFFTRKYMAVFARRQKKWL